MKVIFVNRIIVGVLGLPINKEEKFLLTRRHAPGRNQWHNKWQVAGGGLEFGETPEETLVREFKEELSVTPRVIYPLPIVKSQIWYGDEKQNIPNSQIILVTYIVDIGDQKVDLSKEDETNDWGWFGLAEVLNLDNLPLTAEIVSKAQRICSEQNLFSMLQ